MISTPSSACCTWCNDNWTDLLNVLYLFSRSSVTWSLVVFWGPKYRQTCTKIHKYKNVKIRMISTPSSAWLSPMYWLLNWCSDSQHNPLSQIRAPPNIHWLPPIIGSNIFIFPKFDHISISIFWFSYFYFHICISIFVFPFLRQNRTWPFVSNICSTKTPKINWLSPMISSNIFEFPYWCFHIFQNAFTLE